MDSTYWTDYRPRPDDIVIASPPKAGTTWTQRIVSVLVFQSTRLPGVLAEISPWLDKRSLPVEQTLSALERQEHRRFIKTHLPADALPLHPEVSYVVVGRDPRDIVMSQHHHLKGRVASARAGRSRELPALTGPDAHTPELPEIPLDPRAYWRSYFTRGAFPWETDGWPVMSATRHLETWWAHREASNVLMLHYQDMLRDLDGQMRRVSEFLGIPVNEAIWPDLVRECTFSEMKGRPGLRPDSEDFEFFHKGRNRQWEEFVTEEDMDLFRAALAPLPADLREWLARSE
ncbi:sulfotransferase domain-containing protein [Streptomyces sp. NPDC046909]|uniref:sulfotransferase domain-containing protein n=1 Tax=Streptomyces sp. NPDC046909 TaxID=3155617 RepID=UPI0033D37E4C